MATACDACGVPLPAIDRQAIAQSRSDGTVTFSPQGAAKAGVSHAAQVTLLRGAAAYSKGMTGDEKLCPRCSVPVVLEVEALAAQLGIPEGVQLKRGILDYRRLLGLSGDRWAGYRVEFFGVGVDQLPEQAREWTRPLLHVGNVPGTGPLHVDVRMLWALPPSTRIHVQSVWHPDHGTRESCHGLEHLRSGAEIKKAFDVAERALKLLRSIATAGGRSATSDAEKQEWLTQICEELDRMCVERMLLRDGALAQRLGIGISTLHDRLKMCGRRFTEEKSAAETRYSRRRRTGN